MFFRLRQGVQRNGSREAPSEPFSTCRRWRDCGVEVCDVPLSNGHLALPAVLQELGSRGVLQLMVEGGAVLQGQLLAEGLGEELRVYIGATLLGSSAQSWAQVPLTKTIKEAQFWSLRTLRRAGLADLRAFRWSSGNDVCLEYERAPK